MSKQLNFAQQMDEVLKTLGPQRPKLLLHACCGPCSSAVLEKLCRYFEITVLYYNPNTWPAEEYYRRGEELKKFVAQAHPLGVTVIEDHYDPQEFYTAVQGLENEPERGGRCTVCYRLRMRRAAQYAKEHGFDWFTTTLSISLKAAGMTQWNIAVATVLGASLGTWLLVRKAQHEGTPIDLADQQNKDADSRTISNMATPRTEEAES